MTSDFDGHTGASFEFDATFFDGQSSEAHRARVHVDVVGRRIVIRYGGPEAIGHGKEVGLAQVRVDARIGDTTRAIYLPSDMCLETADNHAADRLELASLDRTRKLRAHMLEGSWLTASLSVAVVTLAVLGAAHFGLPWLAARIANQLPPEQVYQMGNGTLEALDHMAFQPSELALERRQHIEHLVQVMRQDEPELPIRVVFRKAEMPNAFALPDATIVVTDEFANLAKSDEELTAVLAHEMGHVKHRHTLRLALENSAIGLLAFAYLGDASQLASVIASVPTLLAHAHYSQSHETEADTYALEYLDRHSLPRAAFADVLVRLDQEIRNKNGSRPAIMKYFESHPLTEERITRFRQSRRP